MTNKETQLAKELLKTALIEAQSEMAKGIQQTYGDVLNRFNQLCEEHGIDSKTFERVTKVEGER